MNRLKPINSNSDSNGNPIIFDEEFEHAIIDYCINFKAEPFKLSKVFDNIKNKISRNSLTEPPSNYNSESNNKKPEEIEIKEKEDKIDNIQFFINLSKRDFNLFNFEIFFRII